MVRERQIQREKTQIDSKGGVRGGGMEGDDWTIWHLVNRGVLCASGPLWNRPLFYRMELVLKLQNLVGRSARDTFTNHPPGNKIPCTNGLQIQI